MSQHDAPSARQTEPPRPTVAVGAIVLDDDGRLLVVRRGHAPAAGRWTLPGGRQEAGETLHEAVAREVHEETGLRVEVEGLVGVLEVRDDDHHFVILDHHARLRPGQDPTPAAGDDAVEAAWMTRTQLAAAGPTRDLLAFLDRHGVQLAP